MATYTANLGLIGKLVVDFPFTLIELFSPGVTAEVLRVDIDWKSVFLNKVGQFRQHFHAVGDMAVPIMPRLIMS